MQLNKADDKLRKMAISRTVDNSREKSTIHTNDKVLQWTNIQPKEYYNKYLSLRRWLQAADNLISDGFHLRDIFRESLLRTANGNPIANKGQVHGREKGLN